MAWSIRGRFTSRSDHSKTALLTRNRLARLSTFALQQLL